MAPRTKKVPMNFKGMPQAEVPQGRNGKHKEIVTKILSDLDQVQKGVAVKVPLAQLAESKENVRSALNRATRKSGRKRNRQRPRQAYWPVDSRLVRILNDSNAPHRPSTSANDLSTDQLPHNMRAQKRSTRRLNV